MTSTNQKLQILEKLDSLDAKQADTVLEYIKSLLQVSRDEASYKKFKQEALKEIRSALRKDKKMRLTL
jgi:DNA polymerase III delta prime subunit